MAKMVQAFLLEEINGWDDTALHDYLQAHPSLVGLASRRFRTNRRSVGCGTLQRGTARRRTGLCRRDREDCACLRCLLPDRIDTGEADKSQADNCPEHQLIAETTDEVWQQAKPFVTDAFALDADRTGYFMPLYFAL